MNEKKYQIFVSSTYTDLIDERNKIMETILSSYHFPVGMEMFSADDDEQWEIIQETINVSDYYIIIIGHRYGSLTQEGISYTEKEYDYAKEKGLPVLAFIMDRNLPIAPKDRESDPKLIKKLDAFVEKAKANKMCDFWKSTDELATKVALALPKTFRRKPQTGWVRGDQVMSSEVSQELAKLSNENRLLREKLEQFENTISKKRPDIRIRINDSEEALTLPFPSKVDGLIEQPPSKLKRSDIATHLNEYIADDEIDEYNNKLPSNEEIKSFNEVVRKIELFNNYAIELTINIENIGNCKGNDIHVIITFPKSVKVIEQHKLEKLDNPSSPIPESPIEKAQKNYDERLFPSLAHIAKLGDAVSWHSALSAESLLRTHELAKVKLPNARHSTSLKNNQITIQTQSLLHNRKKLFDKEFILIPLQPDNEPILVNIICEEYIEEQIIELPLVFQEIS